MADRTGPPRIRASPIAAGSSRGQERGKAVGVTSSHFISLISVLWSRRGLFATAMLLVVTAGAVRAADESMLEIVTKDGVHVFTVEMAKTDEERQKGLMFRKELPEGRGMLFDFKPDQNVSMWMRNTYIPLDMLFINGDGTIRRIAENTEPLSEKTIPSGGPVRAVLELIGGTAKKLGIKAGDKVAHPLFSDR
jgi:uncharacterized membrane protein (UPF0127 family)